MSLRRKLMMLALVPLAGAAIYKQRAALGLGASVESELLELERVSNRGARVSLEAVRAAAEAQPDADGFKRVLRPGSVDIQKEYNLAGLTIPKEQIHTLLPRDAIPALTDPKTEPAAKAAWLPDDARIIEIVVGADVLGVPLRVLDWHEILNTTVGGEPIAATYCPLCDSATVFSRRVTPAKPKDASGDGSGTKPSTATAPTCSSSVSRARSTTPTCSCTTTSTRVCGANSACTPSASLSPGPRLRCSPSRSSRSRPSRRLTAARRS